MRKFGWKAITVVAVLFVFMVSRAEHYYSLGRAISLTVDQTKVKIRFEDSVTSSVRESLVKGLEPIDSWLVDEYPTDGFYAYSLTQDNSFDQVVTSLRSVEGIMLVEPYYLNDMGEAYNTGSSFVVGFSQDVSREWIEEINQKHQVVIKKISEFTPSVYVLSVTRSSDLGLLDMANLYYEMKETYFSHPNNTGGIKQTAYTLVDKYHSYQWNIKQVIGKFNEASVWDFAGLEDTIVVAVIDEGVTEHFDLDSVPLLSGYDFADGDSNASPGQYCGHGMACAGLIAAEHSVSQEQKALSYPESSGIISINPHVQILPVKIFRDYQCSGDGVSASDDAAAINFAWQHGADVLSNSWIARDFADVIRHAIDSAAIRGRNGKGCAVVFSSGNDAEYFDTGYYSWMAAHPLALGVGACDPYNNRMFYSMYGYGLDLLAPSGALCTEGDIWSLDQEDGDGVNPYATLVYCFPGDPPDTIDWNCPPPSGGDDHFNCKFGGTSAAAPIVAGVASLLLARDPDMPRECDTSDYSVYGVLRGSAVSITDTVPDYESGWGTVDAYRAILSIARGDANNNGEISLGDVMKLVDHVYLEGPPPWPDSLLGDVNCDGEITNGDIMILVDHLFVSYAPLPLPCFEFND